MNSAITDENLIAAFRRGDKRAGETLLTRYKNKILAISRRFFLAYGDTEDLAQEGMCGLYSAMISFEGESGFAAYAHNSIKNRIIDAVKRQSGNKGVAPEELMLVFEDETVPSSSMTPEEALIDSEDVKELVAVMREKLSPMEYRTLSMYMEGTPLAEIASALGKSYKQTDNAICRAKNKLKRVYKKRV